jgi:hypothetical protein
MAYLPLPYLFHFRECSQQANEELHVTKVQPLMGHQDLSEIILKNTRSFKK